MPKIEIDNKPVEVPAGTNLIEAARLLNIEIPHYCYHPGLAVVGSCRMCQVECEHNGRKSIVVGCNTMAADGMKITTSSVAIRDIQRGVLEFYLQHHPLDCPICDDAGECDLQNYYMRYGLHESRVDLDEKRHKHKVHDVGPTVVLDSERCVLCSRCVRFCREIAGVDELGIFGQGGNAELMNVPGKRLENPYAGNVVDLCPVGALTDKDFRFKRRVWYLKRTPSICTGCSRGCNIYVDWETERSYKNPQRRIQRLKPRYNRAVNEWWICDRGRYGYRTTDGADRLTAPHTKLESNGGPLAVSSVIERAAGKIKATLDKHGAKAIAVLASAHSSNEDLFLLKRLFVDYLKVQCVDVNLGKEQKGEEDGILMKSDLSPNRRGALEMGVQPWGGSGLPGDEIVAGALDGDFEVLIVINHDLTANLAPKQLGKLEQHCGYVLYLGTHVSAMNELAHDVIPIAVWAEREASYTNFQGRVQRTWRPFDPLGLAVSEWEVWRDLAARLGLELKCDSPPEVFDSIGESIASFKGLTWEGLGAGGKMLTGVSESPYRKVQSPRPLAAY
ncbi:(2Fe-2S)-binding protein [bacterium]|nr:(2Fe-2S)-binding protein [bacterium]MBU1985372.1 (2Fe-2S)-binding protein [bacterium]